MSPKKSTPKSAPRKKTTQSASPAPEPVVPRSDLLSVSEPTPAPPKVNLVELAKRSLALREQHASKVDGYGRPVAPKPTKAVRYMVQFDDGTCLYADGELADVLFRYVQECEQICTVQGLAYYDGPGMEKIPFGELLARLNA